MKERSARIYVKWGYRINRLQPVAHGKLFFFERLNYVKGTFGFQDAEKESLARENRLDFFFFFIRRPFDQFNYCFYRSKMFIKYRYISLV